MTLVRYSAAPPLRHALRALKALSVALLLVTWCLVVGMLIVATRIMLALCTFASSEVREAHDGARSA